MHFQQGPTPELFFKTINAYQQTAALEAAINLGLFTSIGQQELTTTDIASKCGCSEKGIRVLCDYLVVMGFLRKTDSRYGLTQDTAMFLDGNSPAYMGGTIQFLLSPHLTGGFKDLAEAVRRGGTTLPEGGTMAPEYPVWVDFARAMRPMMALPAQLISEMLLREGHHAGRVLDIAASHGSFGIAIAQKFPDARLVAVDWPNVLEVAKENAKEAGVSDRFDTIAGSAFDVDLGDSYDTVLLTNFLHHFNPATIETFLKKLHSVMVPGGRVVTLEFVPNEDRITPDIPASFSLVMLGSTQDGDAYTFSELEEMFSNAGFEKSELRHIPPLVQQIIVSYR